MSEIIDNTFSAYLGHEFQQKLMWQLLVEPEFAERTIPKLAIEYFDDPNLKRLFVIMLEFINEFEKVPNLQNKSIQQAINTYKVPNNPIEEEALFATIRRIELWNERVLNKQMLHDGEVVQKATIEFIKQQEYRKMGEFILEKTKNGEIKNKKTINYIEDNFLKISEIGNEDETSEEISDNIERSLRENFRETIPTGIDVLDALTGGGLGRSEMGLILAPMGTGKAQPISSKLLTPDGWIKMGDVKVGDLVIGSDGKPQKVLGVFPQGIRPIYKVEFNDQTSTFCDEEHVWAVNSLNQRKYNSSHMINGKSVRYSFCDKSYKPVVTKNLIDSIYKRKLLNYRIPIVKPVEFENKKLPINPYLLGVLIGDGCLHRTTTQIISVDKPILDKCKEIISQDFINLRLNKVSNTITYTFSGKIGFKNPLTYEIRKLNLNVKSDKKFIPLEYKYCSVSNRILLLQGLLDTDGSSTKKGKIEYVTTSKILSEDVRELVLSLGGFCMITERIPTYKYKNEIKNGKLIYRLNISFSNKEIKPFFLERKQERVVYREKYKYSKFIKKIEYSHEEEAQCILVENPDHLYVTDDYILTHNTTILTKIANTGYEVGRNVAHIIFEDNIDDIKRKHYTIWSKIPLSKLDKNKNYIIQVANEKTRVLNKYGRLVIKKFSDDGTTILDIRNWLLSYQKKNGFKFDEIVLDYLDCLESHKRTSDQIQNEFVIVKGFNALISELDVPGWSAIQSNRQGIEAEIVEAYQMGGSIKRGQKAHFLMSIAKIEEQKLADLATIKIIKSRFVKDGYVFKDCIFNNDSLEIKIEDDRFKNVTSYVKNKKRELSEKTNTVDDIKEKSSDLSIHNKINEYTQELVINDNLVQINNNIVLDDNIQNIEPIINNNDINIEAIRNDIIKNGMIGVEENIDIIKDNNEQIITNNNDNDNNESVEFINENKQTNNENHTPSILEILSKKRETQKVIK